MTILFTEPSFVPVSGNSVVYPGAKLYFYETGTSNLQNTYSEYTLTTAHANPVVADADGRFAPIYLDPSLGDYKVVLKDSSDVTIWTVDPYSAGTITANASTISDLLAVDGTINPNVRINGYHSAGDGGGGEFYYDASMSQTLHNGGTIISKDAVFPSDWTNQTQVATWFAPGISTGCWVRVYSGGINVLWFGAINDGVNDDTLAIQKANTEALVVAGSAYFPAGDGYLYKPSADIEIARWIGENLGGTQIICDASVYTGVYFKVDGVDRNPENIRFQNKTLNKAGTCLQISNTDVDAFTGNVRIGPRVTVSGFDKNIDIRNIFNLVFDQVRSEDGAIGVYCAPPNVVGQNGYANTNWYYGCYFRFNDRNIEYDTPIISSNIAFIGGASEFCTGTDSANKFTNVNLLSFSDFYIEGNDSYDSIELISCNTTIDNLYLLNTGALNLGTNPNKITMRRVSASGTNSVFKASGGVNAQTVTMQDCDWPSSGNICTAARLNLINTTINGKTHKFTNHSQETTSTGQITLTNLVNTTVYSFNVPANTGCNIQFDYGIVCTNSGVPRQSCTGRVNLAVYRAGSAAPAGTIVESGQSLIAGSGTLSVGFSITTDTSGNVDIQCIANSSLSPVVISFNIGGITSFGNIALS